MKIPTAALRTSRPARFALWGAAALLLLGVLATFAAPPLVRMLIVGGIEEKLHRVAIVREVAIHPFALSASIRGFELKERDGKTTAASFEELYANLEAASLLRGGLVVKELRLVRPDLKIVRLAEHRYNFSDVVAALLEEPDSDEAPRFSLGNIHLDGGQIDFDDKPAGKRHRISDIRLDIPLLSSLDSAAPVQPLLQAKVNGQPLTLAGKALPFAERIEATLDIDADDIDLPRYSAYLPGKPTFGIARGRLDAKLTLTFSQARGKPAALGIKGDATVTQAALTDTQGAPLLDLAELKLRLDSATPLNRSHSAKGSLILTGLNVRKHPLAAPPLEIAKARLDGTSRFAFAMKEKRPQLILDALTLALGDVDLRLAGNRQPFFTLDSLKVADARLDLGQRRLEIGSIVSHQGKLTLRRMADGSLDLARLAGATAQDKAEAPAAPWAVALKQLDLEGYAIRFEDGTRNAVLQAAPLTLRMENLALGSDAPARLDLHATLDGKGTLATNGEVTPATKRGSLQVELRDLDLTTLQPYLAEHFNLKLKQGALAAKGRVEFAQPPSDAPFQASFRGEANLANLHAIESPGETDLLKWKSLYLGGIQAGTAPKGVSVDEIALSDFTSRLIIQPDGKLNLQKLARPTPETASPPAEPLPLKIGKIAVQGGTIQFSDRYIKPSYSARLTAIGGRVGTLTSGVADSAEIDLRGKLDGGAPLQIGGRLNPFAKELYADIKAEVKGIELPAFSPYSGKYAGYAIEKGKLSLDVRYRIENRKLEAENNLFLDQLTFGVPVESPEATKLPILLAATLLKNSQGEINLRLPISGSLDDPEFNVGDVIGKVLGNLLWKTVSAPFAFLASLFGGEGEELGWLEFAAGRNAIAPAGEEKLAALAKALAAKPGLDLEIAGRADPAVDREGLKHARLERKLKTLKQNDLGKQDAPVPPLDAITVSAEEYPALLRRAYQQEDFPKPRNFLGLAKDLPPAEMEKLLLSHTPASDDDLRNLAARRARAARDWFLEKGGIPAERLFLLAPRLAGEEKEEKRIDKAQGSRVEFSLR